MATKKVFIHTSKAKAAFTPSNARQGLACFNEGRVARVHLQEGTHPELVLVGEVEGEEENCRTELKFHRLTASLLESSCNCSDRNLCSHAYATILSFEELNTSLISSTGIIDVSRFLIDAASLSQIEEASRDWLYRSGDSISNRPGGQDSTTSTPPMVDMLASVADERGVSDSQLSVRISLQPPSEDKVPVSLTLITPQGKECKVLSIASLRQALIQRLPYRVGRAISCVRQEDFTPNALESLFLLSRYLGRDDEGEFVGKHFLAPLLWVASQQELTGFAFRERELRYPSQTVKESLSVTLEEDRAVFSLAYLKEDDTVAASYVFPGSPSAILVGNKVFFSNKGTPLAQHRLCQALVQNGLDHNLIPTFLEKIAPKLKNHVDLKIEDEVLALKAASEEKGVVELQIDTLGQDFSLKVFMNYGRYRAPFKAGQLPTFTSDMEIARDLALERLVASDMLANGKYHEMNQCYLLPQDSFSHFYAQYGVEPPPWLRLSLSTKVDKLLRTTDLPGKLKINQTHNRHFFEVSFSCPDLEATLSLDKIRHAVLKGERVVPTEEGRGYIVLGKEFQPQILDLLEIADFDLLKDGARATIPKWSLIPLMGGANTPELEVDEATQTAFNGMVCDPKKVRRQVPKTFVGELRPYQEQGFQWLIQLKETGLHGILADDMGLGKTVQTIVMLASEKEKNPKGKALIVCPTSLVVNWRQELARFAPSLRIRLIHGSQEERSFLLEDLTDIDVLVTSYSTLQRDQHHYRKTAFHYLILDEAQHIKNPSTRNARTAKSIEADHRLVLTGTPIENSTKDLWSLFDFLMPGFLHSQRTFSKRYLSASSGEVDEKRYHRLKQRIRPFVLRRIKEDVLNDLPPITHMVSRCEMSEQQKVLYLQVVQEVIASVDEVVASQGEHQSKLQILAAITRLKQICCHPQLLGFRPEEVPSAKMDLLMELIYEMMDGGHRAVVFSQYVMMLKLIRARFEKEGIAYRYLDGTTKDRQGEVDSFNEQDEVPIFLVSLRAGGTGLNLIGADRVIHYDLWWNPAVEDQATDRVHRIGQTRQVMSYKLVTNGTIEDKILRLQEEKRELLDCVVNQSEQLLSQIRWDELRELLLFS